MPITDLLRGSKQVPSTRKAFEFKRPTIGEFQARACYEIGDNPRYKNFVSPGLGHNTRSGMNGYAPNVPTPDFNFPSMEAHAQR